MITESTCQPGMCHLDLTSFAWSTDFLVKFSWIWQFLHYHTTHWSWWVHVSQSFVARTWPHFLTLTITKVTVIFQSLEFWSILPCISFQTSDNSMDEAYHNDYIWIWKSLISIKTLQSSVQIRKRGHFKVVKIACLNAT